MKKVFLHVALQLRLIEAQSQQGDSLSSTAVSAAAQKEPHVGIRFCNDKTASKQSLACCVARPQQNECFALCCFSFCVCVCETETCNVRYLKTKKRQKQKSWWVSKEESSLLTSPSPPSLLRASIAVHHRLQLVFVVDFRHRHRGAGGCRKRTFGGFHSRDCV